MKGGGVIYPNKGVKIDPRAITSAKMPESLKVYSGYLKEGYDYLNGEGILTRTDIQKEDQKIRDLPSFFQSENKLISSHWFRSNTHLVEFLRTSTYNYKVYALRIIFFEEADSLFRH
jgi:hypothetical protein